MGKARTPNTTQNAPSGSADRGDASSSRPSAASTSEIAIPARVTSGSANSDARTVLATTLMSAAPASTSDAARQGRSASLQTPPG